MNNVHEKKLADHTHAYQQDAARNTWNNKVNTPYSYRCRKYANLAAGGEVTEKI